MTTGFFCSKKSKEGMVTYIFKFLKAHFFTKQFLRIGILVTGIALTTVGAITFYGQNVGNFVMSLDEELKAIDICMSENPTFGLDEQKKTSSLTAKPVTGARDITYTMVDIKNAVLTNGNFDSKEFKYVGYTFFIQNFGSEATQLNYKMVLSQVKEDVNKAVRIMTIVIPNPDEKRQAIAQMETDDEVDRYLNKYKKIYMLNDFTDEDYANGKTGFFDKDLYPDYPHDCLHPFVSDRIVFDESTQTLGAHQKIQFTLFMWLEGQDPDTTDRIVGGKIKIRMNFSALQKEEEDA